MYVSCSLLLRGTCDRSVSVDRSKALLKSVLHEKLPSSDRQQQRFRITTYLPAQGPDGVVRKLKDRVRALCKQRRIRLQEFFTPFDLHHTKKVGSSLVCAEGRPSLVGS